MHRSQSLLQLMKTCCSILNNRSFTDMMLLSARADQYSRRYPVRYRSNGRRVFRSQKGSAVAKRVDRRVQRTQQAVRSAMLALIQEKGFEALSVQEIIDRANI